MTFDGHSNFAQSTVAVAPSPAVSGTSLTLIPGAGTLFPAAPFNATVWPVGSIPSTANAEIVRVTNVTGDVLTITRSQESSSAQSVTVGYNIAACVTAKTLTDIESQANTNTTNLATVTSNLATVTSTVSGHTTSIAYLNALLPSTTTATVASTAAETLLSGISIPANQVVAGQSYKINVFGVYSTTGTPTLTFTVRYGGPAGTSIIASTAITTPSAASNYSYSVEALITFLSTTSAVAKLELAYDTTSGMSSTNTVQANSAGVTVATTSTNVLEVDVTWGTSSASNTIKGYGIVQRLN